MSNLHLGDLRVTGSNSSRDEKNRKRLQKMIHAIIARRKLRDLGVTIVGVTNDEVIEFYKWYVKQRERSE